MRPTSSSAARLSRSLPRRRHGRRPGGLPSVVRRDVLLVVNARASGARGVVADRAAAALTAAGARVHTHATVDTSEFAAVIAAAAGSRIVLLGGDGTVHALANLDLPALPAVGLLPAGRANNVARALGIPTELRAAARLAVHGRATAVDALRVVTPERSLFAVEGVSAGFHAAARHRYSAENSADLVAGMRALGAELWAYRERTVCLWVDERRLFGGSAAQVFLSNLRFFGFGFEVAPHADHADGRLEALVLKGPKRRDVVALLVAARGGRHLGRPGVTTVSARRARLDAPMPLVADAQPLGITTATVDVAPARLRLVTAEAA